MTEKTLSVKDFAVSDVFENGSDSLVGSKEAMAQLTARAQKSGPTGKLAKAEMDQHFPTGKTAAPLSDYVRVQAPAARMPRRGLSR